MVILLSWEYQRYHRMLHYYLQYGRWDVNGTFTIVKSRSKSLDLIFTDQGWSMFNTMISSMHLSSVVIQYAHYWLCQHCMFGTPVKFIMSYHFHIFLMRGRYIWKYQRDLKSMKEEQDIKLSSYTETFMVRNMQEGFGRSTWQISYSTRLVSGNKQWMNAYSIRITWCTWYTLMIPS